ncbi:MAG: IS256 family transposase [Alcaligenaceae bacterium]|nr:IS256 family transposase [Alcaligenaceae bacterium]
MNSHELLTQWASDYTAWAKRTLSDRRYAYWWAGGMHPSPRSWHVDQQCMLAIVGIRTDGTKTLVALVDGTSESTDAWREVLRDLKRRGLSVGPQLATSDSHMGFWAALGEIYPETRHQHCLGHKTARILHTLPKDIQPQAKAELREIWMAETRDEARTLLEAFISAYQAEYPKAAAMLTEDHEALLAFYDFPAEHWHHLRTTNPIDSTFAAVRHRITRSGNGMSRMDLLATTFRLVQESEKSWRRIRSHQRIR